MSRVHLVTGAAGPYDAVTGQLLAWHQLLEQRGLGGGVHAQLLAPGLEGRVAPLAELAPAADDLVAIHYSGHIAGLERVLELPCRKLLVYHNITPASWFWQVEPQVAISCELGRDRLPQFVGAAGVCAAVSGYNAAELRLAGADDPRVVPILLDRARLAARAAADGDAAPLVLSVGRLAPHKRPDLVIRAFALLQRELMPEAELLCVGPPVSPAYGRRLEELVVRSGAERVRLAGGLPQDELNAAFAQAGVFLSLSEHEGFCIPLLEALVAGLPAVARSVGGMPEVGGNAVVWAGDGDPAVAAELLWLALSDEELRAELRTRARAQAERFSYEAVAERTLALVEDALG